MAQGDGQKGDAPGQKMNTNTDDWARAGFHEVNGELVRINDANRHVHKARDEAAQNHAGDSGEDSQLQEQQNVDTSIVQSGDGSIGARQLGGGEGNVNGGNQETDSDDNQAGISATDGDDDCQHRITITVRFSNRLRTDLSGKLDTILDCIVRARRRLLDKAPGNPHSSGAMRAGKRRSKRGDRAPDVKGPIPF